jgi:hypothetical protein
MSNQNACDKKKQRKKKEAKHDPGACRSKVSVYYDVFKVIFTNAWARAHDFRITANITSVLCNRLLFRIDYEEKISIILKI